MGKGMRAGKVKKRKLNDTEYAKAIEYIYKTAIYAVLSDKYKFSQEKLTQLNIDVAKIMMAYDGGLLDFQKDVVEPFSKRIDVDKLTKDTDDFVEKYRDAWKK